MTTIKEKLKNKIPSVGTWMQIPSPIIAEILSANGYEWVTLDLEHGAFSLNLIPDIIRAIEIHGVIPFIRIAENKSKDIKQALDAGAKGIIAPMIETKKQAEDFISWSSYPPVGTRGIGFSNANLYGKYFDNYFPNINNDLVRIIQIESINALDEIDSIFSVPGLDAAMIGPYDLSGSMNLTGQFDNTDFQKVIHRFQEAANRANLPLGIHIIQPDLQLLQKEIDSGKTFIAFSTDAIMLNQISNIKRNQKS